MCDTLDRADCLESTENLLAGNALFTLYCPETEERYTYHVHMPKNGKHKGKTLVQLLVGPINTRDYAEIGEFNAETGEINLTGKIATNPDQKQVPLSVALIRYVLKLAKDKAPVPAGMELHHAGQCLRCGRVLTVPYPANPYRIYGLGPECGSK